MSQNESIGRSGSRGGAGSKVDPDQSLDPDPESELPESQKELKSDSGAGSRAGIVTPHS